MPWARLVETRWSGVDVRRRLYRVVALSGEKEVVKVHNNSLANLRRAVVERVFAVEVDGVLVPVPRPDPLAFERCAWFLREFSKHRVEVFPYTIDEFVGTYRGAKRRLYENAADSLGRAPLEAEDSHLGNFVKAAKYTKADPAPRVISPRSARYNILVGRYIKRVEKLCYRCIDKVFKRRFGALGPTVFKGMNSRDQGRGVHLKWSKFRNPVAMGADFSRFDQHVSCQALKFEHKFYEVFFHGSERVELRKLLRMQLRNICKGKVKDGWLKYNVVGTRASGDMNTAVGNTIIVVAMIAEWFRKSGVNVELINNGDDSVFIMEREDLARFQAGIDQFFRSFGFSMVLESPVYDLEQVVFCQTQPVWNGDEWRMVRAHTTVACSDSCTMVDIRKPTLFNRWRGGVGTAGICMSAGIPVQQSFYSALRRGTSDADRAFDAEAYGLFNLARGLKDGELPILPAARASYWCAFGVTPEEQECIETNLSVVEPYHHPLDPVGSSQLPTNSLWLCTA